MIRSMSGYGEAARALEDLHVRVEIKTVNHRFLNLSVRTPPGFDRFEQEIQSWLRPFLSRGHAQVVVSLEGAGSAREGALPELDMERARHYATLLRRLRDELELPGEPDVQAIARFSEIFRAPEGVGRGQPAALPEPDALRALVEEAALGLVAMRESEGLRLQTDMDERLRVLGREAERVASLAPARLTRERDRLREQVRELTRQEDVDEDRLAREIAYLAERWDLNEELVRFRAHLEAFREALATGSAEAVGKRLSFLVQEMHREVNTMGAKANDTEVARATIVMKEEIERLREQVENVE